MFLIMGPVCPRVGPLLAPALALRPHEGRDCLPGASHRAWHTERAPWYLWRGRKRQAGAGGSILDEAARLRREPRL